MTLIGSGHREIGTSGHRKGKNLTTDERGWHGTDQVIVKKKKGRRIIRTGPV
jgi:hypothetical protein